MYRSPQMLLWARWRKDNMAQLGKRMKQEEGKNALRPISLTNNDRHDSLILTADATVQRRSLATPTEQVNGRRARFAIISLARPLYHTSLVSGSRPPPKNASPPPRCPDSVHRYLDRRHVWPQIARRRLKPPELRAGWLPALFDHEDC